MQNLIDLKPFANTALQSGEKFALGAAEGAATKALGNIHFQNLMTDEQIRDAANGNHDQDLQNMTMWGGSVMNDVAAYTEGMDNAYGMPDVMLQNMQFGEIAVPVGAAIAGGIASGAAGAAFKHVF